jgi:hypothetical protein
MSGANAQPWEYIVVTDPAIKRGAVQVYRAEMDDYNFWTEQMTLPELRHPEFHVSGDPAEQLRKLRNCFFRFRVLVLTTRNNKLGTRNCSFRAQTGAQRLGGF